MKKSQATNVFNKGMIMDLNPLVTPNDVLTNCLNGTLVTFNGNENVLQNDMGNGRVETAYLPEGYIPLGTAELGGIIYIVSYNPLKNKCQIGSFPSPERNITSDDVSKNSIIISNDDFNWDENSGASIYYVKKEFDNDLTFNPGDKFLIYSNNVIENYDKFFKTTEDVDKAIHQTIRLSIGAITDSGEFINLSNLKTFKNNDGKSDHEYFILQSESTPSETQGVDEYRSIIEQPYTVYQSKISGKLILTCELIAPSDFSISVKNNIITDEQTKCKFYKPEFTFELTGNYNYVPYKLKINGNLKAKTKEISEIWYINLNCNKISSIYNFSNIDLINNSKDIKSFIDELNQDGYFNDNNSRTECILILEITPCMIWGEVINLKQTLTLNLQKIGTGVINLTEWKYLNQDNTCTLNWGLEIYEAENQNINNVKFTLYRVVDSVLETTEYNIPSKKSYFGLFSELIYKNIEYYRVDKPIKSNTIYLVKIDIGSSDEIYKTFYRYLFTNEVFNNNYYNTIDFNKLDITLTPNLNSNIVSTFNTVSSSLKNGDYKINIQDKTEEEIIEISKSYKSLSIVENEIKNINTIQSNITLKNSYNTFGLTYSKNFVNITSDLSSLQAEAINQIKYTDEEDSNSNEYLNASCTISNPYYNYIISGDVPEFGTYFINNNTGIFHYKDKKLYLRGLAFTLDIQSSTSKWDNDKIEINTKQGILTLYKGGDTIDNTILDTPSYVISDFKENEEFIFQNNNWYNTINGNILETIKGYCTLQNAICTFNGSFQPIFSPENIELHNCQIATGNILVPSTVVGFGCTEKTGNHGYAYLFKHNINNSIKEDEKYQVINYKEQDRCRPDFFLDTTLQEAVNTLGITGNSIIIVHQRTGDNGQMISSKNSEVLSYGAGHGITKIYLGLFSNDNKLYPIELTTVIKYQGSGGNDWDQYIDYLLKLTSFQNFYKKVITILNNIYYYSSSSQSQQYIIPNNILWIDSSNLTINFQVNYKLNYNNNYNILLKDSNINIIDLKKIFENEFTEIDSNNLNIKLDSSITEIQKEYSINLSNKNNGKTLRNNFINAQNTAMGAVLVDYDGITLLDEVKATGDIEKLYSRNGNDIISGQSFKPIDLLYTFKDGKIISVNAIKDSSGNYSYINDKANENINKRLKNKNGKIVIDSADNGWECSRGTGGASGKYGGFQNIKLINNDNTLANYEYYII